MNKIFSAVALAATVVTLTLASADVLASSGKGKSKDNKSSSHQSSYQSKGKGSEKSKGHSHNHSKGKGHDHHQGNGYGHDHDDDEDEDGSCEADGDGKGNGHKKHKGKGHQHDHTGYINGVGHHKHHDHDDDDCGGGDDDDDDGDNGGGDNGGGDNGGGDNGGGGVVLPEGCYAGAAWVTLADYTLDAGYKEAIGIAVQSEDGFVSASSDFVFLDGVGAFVSVTPAGGYAVHELTAYTLIDGVETEIFTWQAPTEAGVADPISNTDDNPLSISSAQFDAGIGVVTLICEAGVSPGSAN